MKGPCLLGMMLAYLLSGHATGDDDTCCNCGSCDLRLDCLTDEQIKDKIKKMVQEINENIIPNIQINRDDSCPPTTTTTTELTQTVNSANTNVKSTTTETTTMETTTEAQTTQPETTTKETTTEAQTTQPVTTQPVRHSGPVYENCSSDRTEAYFWISERHTSAARNRIYQTAVQICANCSSVPAVIPDEDTFNKIASTIRRVFTGVGTPQLWLGVTVDQNVDPPYAYVKWFDGHPQSGRPNVILVVTSSESSTMMRSYAGSQKAHGVICWKPQSSAN